MYFSFDKLLKTLFILFMEHLLLCCSVARGNNRIFSEIVKWVMNVDEAQRRPRKKYISGTCNFVQVDFFRATTTKHKPTDADLCEIRDLNLLIHRLQVRAHFWLINLMERSALFDRVNKKRFFLFLNSCLLPFHLVLLFSSSFLLLFYQWRVLTSLSF